MSAATDWMGLDALDALDRCDGNADDAARLLGVTTARLRALEREGRAAKIAALRESAASDASPTPPSPQPPQAPDEDTMTAQPIESDQGQEGQEGWSDWLTRSELAGLLDTTSGGTGMSKALTERNWYGRTIEARSIDAEERAARGLYRNTTRLYRVADTIEATTIEAEPIARVTQELPAVEAVEVAATSTCEERAATRWRLWWTVRRDRDGCLAALDAQREEATRTISRMAMEHGRERDALLEDARRAERERDEARAQLATMREQETTEAAMTRDTITTLERERAAALAHIATAGDGELADAARIDELARERDEARTQRDAALARVSASSTAHLPAELMRVMRAAVELIGDGDVFGVDLRVRVERDCGEDLIRLKRGAI